MNKMDISETSVSAKALTIPNTSNTRRDFLKKSGLYAGVLAGTTHYQLASRDLEAASAQSYQTLTRPSCQIPVVADVDIAIVGASTSAVAAAVAAAQGGARVYVISEENYLGTDICATMRFRDLWEGKAPAFLAPLVKQQARPTPLQIKSYMDDQMLAAKVPFLLATYPSRVLFDQAGQVLGLVIVNRSGEQIIRCRQIIDATRDGSILKLADVKLSERKNPYVEYGVMGDGGRPADHLAHEIKATFYKTQYHFCIYRFEGVPVRNQQEKAKAESLVKGKTWYPGMVDSADSCFYPPAYQVDVKGQAGLESTQLNERGDIHLLNGFGIASEDDLKTYLKPGLTEIGTLLGASLAGKVKSAKAKAANLAVNTGKGVHAKADIALSPFLIYRDQVEVLPAPEEKLPILKTVDVAVVGGGTAGAAAGVGAAENGMNTLVIEPLHGLGGIGTVGAISVYWFGYEGGFNKRADLGVKQIGGKHPSSKRMRHRKSWIKTWKMEWYRREIEKLGGEIWFGTVCCGAVVNGKNLMGVVVSGPFGKGIVLAKRVIDATGSSDVAIAAGAAYTYTDQEHAAIQGSGVSALNLAQKKEYYNTDWTFVAEFDAFDTTRALTLGRKQYKGKLPVFDSGGMVQTRERRRIKGEYTIQAMDVIGNRTYHDTISYHRSNFDSHGYTVDPYFQLKPPNKKAMEASVPLRALLPVGFNNIAVVGLGFSAHRDTMPVLRMQRCLQNQGHVVGYIAALGIKAGKDFREVDLKPVQKTLRKIGTLPARLRCEDSREIPDTVLDAIIQKLTMKLNGLDRLLMKPEVAFMKLKQCLVDSRQPAQRQAAAFILGMYGHGEGYSELKKMVAKYEKWDRGWQFRGMGQFGRSSSPLDDLIIAMGRARAAIAASEGEVRQRDNELLDILEPLAGKLKGRDGFSHFRAIAVATETLRSARAAAMLAGMLKRVSPATFATVTLVEAREKMIAGRTDDKTRNNALKELVTARALYRCGDHDKLGETRLKLYARDLRGHYALHAQAVLEASGQLPKNG